MWTESKGRKNFIAYVSKIKTELLFIIDLFSKQLVWDALSYTVKLNKQNRITMQNGSSKYDVVLYKCQCKHGIMWVGEKEL